MKRPTKSVAPLEHADTLLHVLNNLGPGQFLFIATVSKPWRAVYKRVADVTMVGVRKLADGVDAKYAVTAEMTLFSSVFASCSRVALAHQCGLELDDDQNWKLQRVAGRSADVKTLQMVHDQGLKWSIELLYGAAESALLHKLQWLHKEQKCELPADTCHYAARGNSIKLLSWLQEVEVEPSQRTCAAAAAGGHIGCLQFLREQGTDWNEFACSAAARSGQLSTLQWLHDNGCPWYDDHISGAAAESGSVEMLLYLKENGCMCNEYTMRGAAVRGHLPVCQYLVAEGCPCDDEALQCAAYEGNLEVIRFLHDNGAPWIADSMIENAAESGNVQLLQYLQQQECALDEDAFTGAARGGHVPVLEYLHAKQCPFNEEACTASAEYGCLQALRWLIEHGCPYDAPAISLTAAESGDVNILQYTLHVAPAGSAQLTELLNAAGTYTHLNAAKWLRQQGAEWPAVLMCDGRQWPEKALSWATQEGCTSPIEEQT
jgi:hypothetical protein